MCVMLRPEYLAEELTPYFNKIWGSPLDDDVLHCHHDL
jgi:hypothetical protein